MIIKTDGMDRMMYSDARHVNPGLQELEKKGEPKAKIWPTVVRDIWAGLFKAAPQMDPNATGPLAKAMEDVLETQEWKKLRTQTKLNEFGASVGTAAFGNQFLDGLPEDILEAQQTEEDAKRATRAIVQSRGDRKVPRDAIRKAIEEAKARRGKAAQALQTAQENHGGDIESAVRVAAREAASVAEETTADAKEMAFAWSSQESTASRVPIKQQLEFAKRVQDHEVLKLVAKLMGRMKRMAMVFQARKIEKQPEEIVDIELGNDLRHVIPSEKALLMRPETKLWFFKKFINRQLLQHKKEGRDKAGKGPIVLMRDESGSMCGQPFAWAAAIGLALAWIAQKQKRSLILGGFSYGGDFWSREYPLGKIAPEEVEHWCSHFFGGGTDFEMALEKSFDAIEKSEIAKKADLIFLSDGECYCGEAFLKKFLGRKADVGIRIISIGVGCSEDSFRDFSDISFGLKGDIDKDDAALEKVFSI